MNEPVPPPDPTTEAQAVIQRLLNQYRVSSRQTASNLRLQLSGASHVSLVRWLFLRLLALVYVFAFVSFWVQADGLVGDSGILPVAATLDRAGASLPDASGLQRFVQFPTLCWVGGGAMVTVVCLLGTLSALVAVTGVASPLAFFLAWACYLSICTVGLSFMSGAWDSLLLEAGFLAIFFAPWQWKPSISKESPPSFAILLLYRWLVFRLVLGGALVKLVGADGAWFSELGHLGATLQNQPLPPWTAWYVHHLPGGLLGAAATVALILEVVLPIFILLGRRLRLVAFVGLVTLQVVMLTTVQASFHPLLTMVLCLLLLDDTWLSATWRAKFVDEERPGLPGIRLRLGQGVGFVLLVLLFSISATRLAGQVRDVGQRLGGDPELAGTSWMQRAAEATSPFRLVGSYGRPFPTIARRPDIVIEGSQDGETWKPYVFARKPGPLDRRPPGAGIHLPRLDWQMAYAAQVDIQHPEVRTWFVPLVKGLLDDSESVVGLLAQDPFEDASPRYIRALLYEYAFTDPDTRKETGDWWKRAPRRVYCPVIPRQSP